MSFIDDKCPDLHCARLWWFSSFGKRKESRWNGCALSNDRELIIMCMSPLSPVKTRDCLKSTTLLSLQMDQLLQAVAFIYNLFLTLCYVNDLRNVGWLWLQLFIIILSFDTVDVNFLFSEYRQIIKWLLHPFTWWTKICMVWVCFIHSTELQNYN